MPVCVCKLIIIRFHEPLEYKLQMCCLIASKFSCVYFLQTRTLSYVTIIQPFKEGNQPWDNTAISSTDPVHMLLPVPTGGPDCI